jgi:hypothetical protein
VAPPFLTVHLKPGSYAITAGVWFLSAIVDWSNLPGNADGRKLLNAQYLDTIKYIYTMKIIPFRKLKVD